MKKKGKKERTLSSHMFHSPGQCDMTHSSQCAGHRGTCIHKEEEKTKTLSSPVFPSMGQCAMTHSSQCTSHCGTCIHKGEKRKKGKSTFESRVSFVGAV